MIDLTPGRHRYRTVCRKCEVAWSSKDTHSNCWNCGDLTKFRAVLGTWTNIHYLDFRENITP